MLIFLTVRAVVRMLLLLLLIGIGALCVLLLGLIPLRVGGARLAAWPVVFMARLFMAVAGIDYHCAMPAVVRDHQGMIFCNHTAFIDTLLVLYVTPARFLSTKGVRKLPVIGQIAVALETIFLNRFNQAARTASRTEIAEALRARPYPPLVLFPEGTIGPGHTLLPFRRGAFEIAQQEQVSILPCVLYYEPLDVVTWYESRATLPTMAWRLLMQRRPVKARLLPLPVVKVAVDADIDQVAEQMRQALQTALHQAKLAG
ncbi:MAG: 1-acyl-sn-glycerol-3-phosphate acyltransferase [Caldilineaceae bacterium]|nr:1-acyl-sn-glycerol-3-phosphate acyltransferase [Caldilineaceae bacterium]